MNQRGAEVVERSCVHRAAQGAATSMLGFSFQNKEQRSSSCLCVVQDSAQGRAHVHMEGSSPWLELLLGISGAFRPKVLTCLMGVTGAGKTTLMDVLAGRKTGWSSCIERSSFPT